MILVERHEENNHLEDLGINEGILLKWILSGTCRYRRDFFWFFIGTGGGIL